MSSDEWSRVYDQSTESYYYWNILTYEVSWEEPLHWNAAEAAQRERKAAGLSIGDAPEGLAMLLATRKIQSIFRSRRARKILHSWSHVYDPNTESYYYWNTISYEVAWEPPPGYSIADANKRERDAAGLGIEQLPHGLGLLVATRKLQGAWRRKKARQKSREYNAARAAEGAPEGGVWIRMDDPASGYPYWYHRDTHETVWKNPYPKALGNRYKDSDSTIFHKERKVFVLLFMNHYPKILSIPKLNILSKHLTIAIPLSIQVTKLLLPSKLLLLQAKQNQLKDEWPQHRQKMKFGPLISCGSLMALRIRGKEECEKIADVLNGLRLLSGDVMHPIPHLQNKIERFKLNEKMLLYRGNRRWLQKHRVGLLGNMCDVVWLCSAIHRKEEVKKCVTMNMNMKIDNGYEIEKGKGRGGEGRRMIV